MEKNNWKTSQRQYQSDHSDSAEIRWLQNSHPSARGGTRRTWSGNHVPLAKGGDARFSLSGYAGSKRSGNCFRIGTKSQIGTCLPLPGIKSGQPRPGHHRSHPQRQRTVLSHPFQTPQRLPRRLDRATETVWDEVKKSRLTFFWYQPGENFFLNLIFPKTTANPMEL